MLLLLNSCAGELSLSREGGKESICRGEEEGRTVVAVRRRGHHSDDCAEGWWYLRAKKCATRLRMSGFRRTRTRDCQLHCLLAFRPKATQPTKKLWMERFTAVGVIVVAGFHLVYVKAPSDYTTNRHRYYGSHMYHGVEYHAPLASTIHASLYQPCGSVLI